MSEIFRSTTTARIIKRSRIVNASPIVQPPGKPAVNATLRIQPFMNLGSRAIGCADTPCAWCVSRHAPTDARYWLRQYAGVAVFGLALSRVTTRAYSSLDARYLRYAGVGGWLFAYRAVRPARRDMQIRRRPFMLFTEPESCVKLAMLWLASASCFALASNMRRMYE